MKYLTITIIFVLFCIIAACSIVRDNIDDHCSGCREVPVKAVITVKDTRGNVLIGHDVSWSGFGLQPKTVQKTDNGGQVNFDFGWHTNDSGFSYWAIQGVENNTWKGVNLLLAPSGYGPNQGKVTIFESITMDSLTTFKVRVKTNRSDINWLSLVVGQQLGVPPLQDSFSGTSFNGDHPGNYVMIYNDKINQIIRQQFLNHSHLTNTPQLDTIFQTKAFSQAPFEVKVVGSFTKEPKNITQKIAFTLGQMRDSTLVITL